tara:strand:- start:526 stop:696 length:171 start_codon:yes stop_codon:yes gene_type:complete
MKAYPWFHDEAERIKLQHLQKMKELNQLRASKILAVKLSITLVIIIGIIAYQLTHL